MLKKEATAELRRLIHDSGDVQASTFSGIAPRGRGAAPVSGCGRPARRAGDRGRIPG